MPIPVRRLLIGRPGQNRTDFGGLSDRSSAIELQDIRYISVGTPARNRTLVSGVGSRGPAIELLKYQLGGQ